VFAAFAVAGAPSLRELGVGLAVAVGLDASLVRLVVVPATMRLLGDWNWWVPRRLAKLGAVPMRAAVVARTASRPRIG
jgi:RND superfamily putative drug exporter